MSRVIAAFSQFFDGSGDPLESGWLKFLVSGTNNTGKLTYTDVNQTIENPNPVQLDAEGRCPNVFGQGSYKVILYENNPVTGLPGVQVQEFDPVFSDYSEQEECFGGNFGEWNSEYSYQVSQIVVYDGLYYRSITALNLNNPPDTSPVSWEQIDFLRYWNTNVTYLTGNVVIYSNVLYFSLLDANTGNAPLTSPTWWSPVGSGTTLFNWRESGTSFIPTSSGYNIGDSSHTVGSLWLNDFAQFPLTPSSAPTADYHVSNKKYADDKNAENMKWSGDWVPGTYDLYDVVLDDNWLMIANTTTTDRPAPQPVGDAEWVRELFSPPAFSTTSDSQSVLYIGQRYLFTPPAFTVSTLRVYFPSSSAGLNVEFWAIYDPAGANQRILNLFPGFNISSSQTEIWIEIPTGSPYVEDGTTIDIVMVFRPGTGGSTFTYEWDYIKANGDPLPGDIHHQGGGSVDEIRIHEQDTSLVDRSTDLDYIGPGSVIEMNDSGYVWEVLSASKTGDIYTFIVDPGARAGNATSDFTFTYFGTTTINYVYNTNLYSSEARIKGFFGPEYDPSEPTYLNENGYGLDIKVQAMTSSSDWDVLTPPSSGGITSSNASTLNGYTSDEFAVLAENETITGQWDFTGDTPTINSHLIYSAENGPMTGRRNAIINGDFQVWQRGTSGSSAVVLYVADRWFTSGSGSTVTSTRQTFTPGQTDVPGNPKYFYRFAISAAEDNWYLGQLIEGVDTYAGQQVTLSLYARIDTSKTLRIGLQQRFGIGGSTEVPHTQDQTITTSWVRYSYTVTLTSISGKAVGTHNALFLTLLSPTSQSGYYDVARVRLEPGPVATLPEKVPYSIELHLCQRSYEYMHAPRFGFQANAYDIYRNWNILFSVKKYAGNLTTVTISSAHPVLAYSITEDGFRGSYDTGTTTATIAINEWTADAEIPLV